MKKDSRITKSTLLEDFYNFSKAQWSKIDSAQGKIPAEDRFYRFLTTAAGFDSLPQVVSDENFNNLKTMDFYRGAVRASHIAKFLTEKDCRHAQGYMSGYFACATESGAANYTTTPLGERVSKKVLKFKMKDARFVTKTQLEQYVDFLENGGEPPYTYKADAEKLTELYNFICQIKMLNEQVRFFKLFKNDLSKLAVYLGYDYIIENNPPARINSLYGQSNDIVVLNRGAVVTSESEFSKFTGSESTKSKI